LISLQTDEPSALQGILLVYDVTNPASFDNLDEWLHIINKVFAATKKPHLALVGNKGLFCSF